ncbi:hypothetical protein [Ramlibacter sp. AN1133]|uniref:hypothetical protein n=1 Tax=Ramlibacter sp. AN1133 TaxID=3133429 RepID=UPI0030C59C95
MRILLAVSSAFLVLLAGCSMPRAGGDVAGAACERATVPPGAVFGVRDRTEIATWPPEMARGVTGCQRVWYGDRAKPETMQVLATYYFEGGRVRRLTGRVPNGAAYDCKYSDGELDAAHSQNPSQCPRASEIEVAR